MLLFVRFARELKRRGATVLVLCQALLKELLGHRRLHRHRRRRGREAAGVRPPCLDGVAAASLPRRLRRAGGRSPPICIRRPTAASSSAASRRPSCASASTGPPCPASRRTASARRRSPSSWRWPAIPELLVFSLQGGVHQRDIQQFGAGGLVHDVGRGIFDFAEAATALSQLDLLLSIDAPIAHLAAAMGLPDLGAAAVDGRLALAARRHAGALVSLGAPVPPARAGRLGVGVRQRSGPNSPSSSAPAALTGCLICTALQILRVVDIVQHVGQAARDSLTEVPPACRPAPAPSTIVRRRTRRAAAACRRRAPTSQKPPSLAGPNTRSCGRADERRGRCGRRAAPECRCRPAPRVPAAAPGTAASCVARDRPAPWRSPSRSRNGAAPGRMAEGSRRASRTARPSSGGRSPAA